MPLSLSARSKPHLRNLADFIQNYLDRYRLNPLQFSIRAGLSKTTVYAILRAEQEPTRPTLKLLADALSSLSGEVITAGQLERLMLSDVEISSPEVQSKQKEEMLFELIRSVSLSGVMDAISIGFERLQRSGIVDKTEGLIKSSSKGTMQGHTIERTSMPQSVVSLIILDRLQVYKLSKLEFLKLAGDELTLARLEAIVDEGEKPTEAECRALVRAFAALGETNWHWTYLDRLYVSPVKSQNDAPNGVG